MQVELNYFMGDASFEVLLAAPDVVPQQSQIVSHFCRVSPNVDFVAALHEITAQLARVELGVGRESDPA